MKAKPTPLIDAAGTKVERIRPDRVKKSTAPERIWPSVSVSEPSWLEGKICSSKRPPVSSLILFAASCARTLRGWRQREVVRELVGELRGAGAADREGRDGRGSGADRKAAAGHDGHGVSSLRAQCGRPSRPCTRNVGKTSLAVEAPPEAPRRGRIGRSVIRTLSSSPEFRVDECGVVAHLSMPFRHLFRSDIWNTAEAPRAVRSRRRAARRASDGRPLCCGSSPRRAAAAPG